MADYKQSRRKFPWSAGALGLYGAFSPPLPAWCIGADSGSIAKSNLPIDLTIAKFPFEINGRFGNAIAINSTVPGPIIRLKEGTEAVINVTNYLQESASIHWHGLILPPEMDGVPGVSFAGIAPGDTFTYRFPVNQSGTYW